MTRTVLPTLSLVALSRGVLAELLAPGAGDRLARIAGRLDESVDAVILGADLVPPPDAATVPTAPGIDVTIAAITLAHVTEYVGLITAVAPHRDHPYNVARRIASIDHASGGRAGVFITARDPVAPAGSPWTTAPPDAAAVDAVTVLRELWRSYPIDSVVGDSVTGVFTESHRIVAVDHRGPFDVTGPLQVPSSPQLFPPVLAWAHDTAPRASLADVVDIEIALGDPRFDIGWPGDVAELEQALAGGVETRTGPTHIALRARLGLPAAVAPAGGRRVFPDPAEQPGDAQKVGSHGR